jgi:mannose-6-phosphate isomerase-like protein (cupin superfamily)
MRFAGVSRFGALSSPLDCFDKDAQYAASNFAAGNKRMTGILENPPGPGHNQPTTEGAEKENQHWDRWAKKRTFVRALEGTYSHLYKQLVDQPRVFSSKDVPWKGGPGHYGKSVISPQAVNITQSIESHIEAYAPGASGQKHGHLNSAVFYVLKGHGHDVHDGRHIPWKAGDVMLVENACVHQHFNDSKDEEAILLVFKAKPLFLFMHLLFQKIVEWPSKIPPKGAEGYKPPADI